MGTLRAPTSTSSGASGARRAGRHAAQPQPQLGGQAQASHGHALPQRQRASVARRPAVEVVQGQVSA
jgi:hypothetical protein